MARKGSGEGDPRKTLRLLWRGTGPDGGPRRGRRPRVTVDQIVAAAVAVADRENLDAMTMEKVAGELGLATMSLYTHIPGRAELVDLMVDAVWRELGLPLGAEPRPDGWRAQIELYARRASATHRRHPWLREISTVRPPLGPGLLARQEYLLSVLTGAGLTARRAAAAAGAVVTFVEATAGTEAEHALAERVSGQSERDWWAARQAFWDDTFDPARYPAIARAWQEGGLLPSAAEASADARDFGLRGLLDGIEAALRR
ncbi:TetR/AcrR family transcriptional regulator C-terminal domain-containing protein [Streptomyces sp. NPDC003077]|uniref:TetR/AcrR family transcriptional regulator n=1 Tax=Streptomyces sp. NPDC003077 TaxID=3154443 RepID=UPI0033BD16F3